MKNPVEFQSLFAWGSFALQNFATAYPQSVCTDRIADLTTATQSGSKGIDLIAEEFEQLITLVHSMISTKQIRAFVVFPLGHSKTISMLDANWLSKVNLVREPPSIHFISSFMPLAIEGEEYLRHIPKGMPLGEYWGTERAFFRCWRTEVEILEEEDFSVDLYIEAFHRLKLPQSLKPS
jgi:hypothetical protein